jgi:hypothetical protein
VTVFRRWGPARTRGERIMRLLIRCALAVLVAVVLTTLGFQTAVRAGYIGPHAAGPLSGDLHDAKSDRPGLRVLFLGNSITFQHEDDVLLTRLAVADPANPPVFAVRYAPGGWTLRQHAAEPEVRRLLTDVHWNVVVLQEQSELAAYPTRWRKTYTDPAVRTLVREIRAAGARPLLFETPGYRTGDGYHFTHDSYSDMQYRSATNAIDLGEEFRMQVAPVGNAYELTRHDRPRLVLWEADGVHPTLAGSYLAACVIYQQIFDRPPKTGYTAGLTPTEAGNLEGEAELANVGAV